MKALVTGASSGIGRDIAEKLSDLGYDIILVGRNNERLQKTADSLKTKSYIICRTKTLALNYIKMFRESLMKTIWK